MYKLIKNQYTFYYYYLLINFCINAVGLYKMYSIFDLSFKFFFVVLLTVGFNVLIFILCHFIFRRFFKYVLAVLFLLNSMFAYSLLTLGIEINFESLFALIHAGHNDILDFVNIQSILFVSIFGVAPTLILFKIETNSKQLYKITKHHLIPSLVIIFLVVKFSYSTFKKSFNDKYSEYILPYSYLESGFKYLKRYTIPKLTHKYKTNLCTNLSISDKTQNTLFVFVLGESSRADRYSLNGYKKITNPNLSKQKNLFNFSNFTSCATYTAKSVPCIFSPLPQQDFSIPITTKNIIHTLSSVNFDTKWYSSQHQCYKACAYVEKIFYARGQSHIKKDTHLLSQTDEMFKQNKQNSFLVIHTYGSHGPYEDKFPKNMPNLITPYKGNIDNLYDNTIIYTDYFINEIIEKLKKDKEKNIILMFTSDHGESLGENGVYGHGSTFKKAGREQKYVPFMIWMNDNFIKHYNVDTASLIKKSNNIYSHDNIFHSILDILGIKTSCLNEKLSIFK